MCFKDMQLYIFPATKENYVMQNYDQSRGETVTDDVFIASGLFEYTKLCT